MDISLNAAALGPGAVYLALYNEVFIVLNHIVVFSVPAGCLRRFS